MSAAPELRAAVARQREDLRDLLAELVAIESHASQPEGVARVARTVERSLAGAGIAWERVRGREPPAEDRWLAELMLPGFEYGRVADVVVGRRKGHGARVLLLADLDTAFEPGVRGRLRYHIEGDRAYGPGVADMKGGLVVLVAALRTLPTSASPTITIVLSPDEQAGSLSSRAVIEAAARDADCCLCLECARDGGNVMASRAHIGVARLDTYGREAHAGSAHASGANAFELLAHLVVDLQRLCDPGRQVYVTATLAGAGRRRSVIPGHAWCVVDIRTPDAGTWADTERRIREIVSTDRVPGTRAEVRIRDHRPGVSWTERTDRLLEVVRRAGVEAGIHFGAIRSPAAGSSAFAGGLGIPTVDGMGPLGGELMTEREHVELRTIEERALLLALTLHHLAKENGGKLA